MGTICTACTRCTTCTVLPVLAVLAVLYYLYCLYSTRSTSYYLYLYYPVLPTLSSQLLLVDHPSFWHVPWITAMSWEVFVCFSQHVPRITAVHKFTTSSSVATSRSSHTFGSDATRHGARCRSTTCCHVWNFYVKLLLVCDLMSCKQYR
eukprot:SAG11_NODE_51_length_19848_cov_37.780698_17_plen_149_part_00